MVLAFMDRQRQNGSAFDFGSNMMIHEEKRYLDGRAGVSEVLVYTLLRREGNLQSSVRRQHVDTPSRVGPKLHGLHSTRAVARAFVQGFTKSALHSIYCRECTIATTLIC